MKDLFQEIWESIQRNKLRTVLTGFAVAWGIFILIVLLGAGNGLMNAFMRNGDDFASNTMAVYGGYTSKPYEGLQEGRWIQLNDKDITLTESAIFSNYVDDVTASTRKGPFTLVLGDRHTSVYVCGCYPKLMEMNKIEMLDGRFINTFDMQQQRKSIVLASSHAQQLLNGGDDYASLIGKNVRFNDNAWLVVGVYKTDKSSQRVMDYVPLSTLQLIFNERNYEEEITFTFHGLETEQDNKQFEKTYKAVINKSHKAAPDDDGALWIWNRFTQNQQMNKGNSIIRKALWVLGILTLLGGIVGVSNIMLITVKERTQEFGIRKSIGATPMAIMKLIIAESVTITAFFGYIGMFLGMVACEIMKHTVGDSSLEMFGESMQFFVNPTVGLDVAFGVTLVLIVAGTLAGMSPALKAARIRPIEALRDTK